MRTKADGDQGIKKYVRAILKRQGRDFGLCELCGRKGKTEIHHNKYNNATLSDIKLVCHSCNMKASNKLLD